MSYSFDSSQKSHRKLYKKWHRAVLDDSHPDARIYAAYHSNVVNLQRKKGRVLTTSEKKKEFQYVKDLYDDFG